MSSWPDSSPIEDIDRIPRRFCLRGCAFKSSATETFSLFGGYVSSLQDRFSFFVATDALKETRRANWIYSAPRQESVAEHVWHTTLLAMLLADAAPAGINHDHVRDLLTIHDLVEVYAGDTVLWDNVAESDVAAREMVAGERLTSMLPVSRQGWFDRLWREFQTQETSEARWARAIDSLHPMVLSWYPGGQGHANKTLTPTKILTRKRPFLKPFPPLWELARWLVQQAVNQHLIPADDMTRDAEVGNGLAARFDFFVATDGLKELRRANWVWSESRHETVAEHVWHTTLLGLVVSDSAPEQIDHNHVRDLLTIHDLVEVYAGDTVIWDEISSDSTARELAAGERLIAMLPESLRSRFDPLWREFQAQETINARYARAIDTLHPMVMDWFPGGSGHVNEMLTPTLILARKQPLLGAFPELWHFAQWLVQQAVDQHLIPGDDLIVMTEDTPRGQT